MGRAVKGVKKSNRFSEHQVRHEISILQRLDHPCICKLLETYEDKKTVFLVMEFIDGLELFDEIQVTVESGLPFDQSRAARIMRQVFSALQYCHEHEVIHRDLKP